MSVQRLFRRNGETYNEKIKRLGNVLAEADTIVIGAGAGLSTSADFVYDGERFEKYFSDFKTKYGFRDVFGRVLALRYIGRTLGILEPVYLDQPVYGCPGAGV